MGKATAGLNERHIPAQDTYTIKPTPKVKRSALELGDAPLKANCGVSYEIHETGVGMSQKLSLAFLGYNSRSVLKKDQSPPHPHSAAD